MIESGGAENVTAALSPIPRWALALPLLVVLFVAAAGGTVLLALSHGVSPVSVAQGTAVVGRKAPDFSSWDLSGEKVSLADFKNRPLLVTFWATWCTACHEELPELQRLQDTYRSTGFTVLAVNYKETDDARMSQYLAGLRVNLKTVIDPEGAIAAAYGVEIGLPISVLLDRKAIVSQVIIGLESSAALGAAVDKLVEASP